MDKKYISRWGLKLFLLCDYNSAGLALEFNGLEFTSLKCI